tara:strand:+ start:9337 stop:9906 length:570 start_codon:yes stop_codon:yes gene_type:complete
VKVVWHLFGLVWLFALAGCDEQVPPPPPAALDRTAQGFFCGMIVADHKGPKAQIHLEDRPTPIWFTSVRDAVAYLRMPEGGPRITGVYVHDMARAQSWENPGDDAWVPAEDAIYVIGSSRRGGMGALETVPFSDRTKAQAFVKEHGGQIVALGDIPESYILGTGAEENALSPRNEPQRPQPNSEKRKSQ